MGIQELLSDTRWLGITAILGVLTFIQGLINRFTDSPGWLIGSLVIAVYFFSFILLGWLGILTHIVATVIMILVVRAFLRDYQ